MRDVQLRPRSSAAELAEAERVQLQRARRLPVAGLYAAVFVSYGGRRQAVDEGQEAAQGHEPAQRASLLWPGLRNAVGGHRSVLRRAALGGRRKLSTGLHDFGIV